MDLEQVKELLPDIVLQIAGLVGYPVAADLVRILGGTSFRFSSPLIEAMLTDDIGPARAATLKAHFGEESLYLPRCDRALRELRNRSFVDEFCKLCRDGISSPRAIRMLCPKYGFSDRYAWGLLSQQKHSPAQGSLF
jgi:hypothetical protein